MSATALSIAMRNAGIVKALLATGFIEPEYTERQKQRLMRKAKEEAGEATSRICEADGCSQVVTTFTKRGKLMRKCFIHSGAKRRLAGKVLACACGMGGFANHVCKAQLA